METLRFNVFMEFSGFVNSLQKDAIDLSIIGKAYEIEALIKDLIPMGDYSLFSIEDFELDDEDDRDYVLEFDDEFNMYVWPFDPACVVVADYILISSNANSKIIDRCRCESIDEYHIGEDDECDGDCDNCPYSDNDEEDGLSGFSHNWTDENGTYHSFTYYGNNAKDVHEIASLIFK